MIRRRIWELDALRGVAVLGMVFLHFLYDLHLMDLIEPIPSVFLLMQHGGTVFILLSGICVTLGSHPRRRGFTVFCCGMLCSTVTAALYFMGYTQAGIIIFFGVLHCLGSCMMLWPLFSPLPGKLLAILGLGCILAGSWVSHSIPHALWFLLPLGYTFPGFASSDYFPLFPNLGYFLLGALLGKAIYPSQTTLFPNIDPHKAVVSFFCRCGRWSLPIYLLHQPLITLFLGLLPAVR